MPEIPDGGDYAWTLVWLALGTLYAVADMLRRMVGYVVDRMPGRNGNGRGNGHDRVERRSGLLELERDFREHQGEMASVPRDVERNRKAIEALGGRTAMIERTMATRADLQGLATKEDIGHMRDALRGLSDRLDRHFEDSDRWRRETPPGGEPRR